MKGWAVFLLTMMNLLNYIDRYVPSAVKDGFKADLHLSDAQTSLPLTAFVLVYVLASPLFGALADRFSRPRIIAIGVIIWSVATALAAFAWNFELFFAARALVGVGEAAYATIAPSLISDLYPANKRNRVLTIFYMALPVGAAIGFSLGGVMGAKFGWRMAFLLTGAPGILVAAMAFFLPDPPRGAMDQTKHEAVPGWGQALRTLAKNHVYLCVVAGYTLVMFAAGGIADWFPTFLMRHRGFAQAEAGYLVGVNTVIGGIAGTVVGSFLGDKLVGKTRHPYLALAAFAMVPATLFASLTLMMTGKTSIALCLFLGQFFAWFYNGPINALLVNSVPSGLRARAFALSILSTHLLGDAISPPVIGWLSDHGLGLWGAMWLVPLALAGGTLIWIIGWRRLQDVQTTGRATTSSIAATNASAEA